MRHDITVPLYVEVDEIWNLACPASPVHYQCDPVQTTKVSVHGAINMLGLARRLKCPILQASTSEVYGDPNVHPQREDYWGNVNPLGPRACYDEGKRCAETLFFDYWRQHERRSRSPGSSMPMVRACSARTGGWCRTSSSRRSAASRSRFSATARRRARSAIVDDLIAGLMALMASPPAEYRPDQHRQPAGDHDPRARRDRHPENRIVVEARDGAVADRRSAAPATGHHARPRAAGMGAAHSARAWPRPDDRLFRIRPAAGRRARPLIASRAPRLDDMAVRANSLGPFGARSDFRPPSACVAPGQLLGQASLRRAKAITRRTAAGARQATRRLCGRAPTGGHLR